MEKAPQKFCSREARKLGLSLCFVLLWVMFEIGFVLPVWQGLRQYRSLADCEL